MFITLLFITVFIVVTFGCTLACSKVVNSWTWSKKRLSTVKFFSLSFFDWWREVAQNNLSVVVDTSTGSMSKQLFDHFHNPVTFFSNIQSVYFNYLLVLYSFTDHFTTTCLCLDASSVVARNKLMALLGSINCLLRSWQQYWHF